MTSFNGFYLVGPDGTQYSISPTARPPGLEIFQGMSGAEIGSKIRELREQKRLGQRELAGKALVTPASLNRLETGKISRPQKANLRSLLMAIFD